MNIYVTRLNPVHAHRHKRALTSRNPRELTHNVREFCQPIIDSFEKIAIGRYFWFIVDFRHWSHFDCGGDVESLTPYTRSDFLRKDHSCLHRITHPDDIEKVFAFSQHWLSICNAGDAGYSEDLKMTMFFRIKEKEAKYYWALVQYPQGLFNSDGKIEYGLVLVTDMTHLNFTGPTMMQVYDYKRKFYQQCFCEESIVTQTKFPMPKFTKREREVLCLLSKGLTSKEIANELKISVKTIDNHRQNMLRRSNSRSTNEMVSVAVRFGLV